jgi:hypothetical protein
MTLIWRGAARAEEVVLRLLYQLIAILIATRVVVLFVRRLGQTDVSGEILELEYSEHALSPGERERGVIGVSAGNHAQALAWAAATEGVDALVEP